MNNIIPYRVGIGHDTHRFTKGDGILLGGVSIPFEFGLLGHSDADVLLHAIMDALLGALALGDIGEHFPDTDPANRGRSSVDMLQQVVQLVEEKHWSIANLDTIVFAERPKLGPWKDVIRQRLAEVLHLDPDQVSLKAKTGEKIGIIGRREAISAEAVVLLAKVPLC